MSIKVLIGGTDYTKYVDLPTVKISSNIAVSQDTVDLTIIIPKQEVSRPKGGQEIQIMNGNVIEYGGVILIPQEFALATDQMMYNLQCKDYTFWLDKRLVVNTYTSETAGNIVKDIVNSFTSGFTSNHVKGTDGSFIFSEIKFDHIAPSEAIKKLADDVSFQWWVDYEKDVHFGDLTSDQSPLPNNTLLADTDIENYSELEIDEDVSQVRNQVYLRGYKVPANYSITEKFTTDGENTTFYTTYEPKHLLKDITVTLNGVAQGKDLDIAGGLPNNQLADGKVYIFYKNQSYRFNQAPASGQTLSITYIPMFELISMQNDPNAMDIMKKRDLQDGVYEYGIRDQQLTSIDSSLATTRGQLELYKYAYPHITGQFNSFLQGWQPGQYFYLTSDKRMDGELQNYMLYVVKVDKEIVTHPFNGSPTFKYIVYFSDTPYVY